MSRNAILLPKFLTEAAIIHGKSDTSELLKIFSRSITEWALDAAPTSEADEASNDNSVVKVEATEEKKSDKTKQDSDKTAAVKTASSETKKPGKSKQASAEMADAEMLASIADDCDNVLAFFQAVAVKSPRVIAAPLSLCADKRVRVWF